ncbi:oligoendopeptidase F, partial [Streptococcus pyogenes]
MTDNRSHLEEKYTWDLSTIFATDKDWEAEVSDLATEVEASKGFAGHLLDSSANLLKVTKTYLELARRVEKVYVYAHMKNDQDTTVAKYQEYQAKASGLYAKF